MQKGETVSVTEFISVTVSFFIHSTEEEKRLVKEVSSALGFPDRLFVLENLEGHYGNLLYAAKAHLTGRDANTVAKRLFRALDPNSKKALIPDLKKNIDEHDALYLRLDRQTIPQSLEISSEEPIRVKVKPKSQFRSKKGIENAYAELMKNF